MAEKQQAKFTVPAYAVTEGKPGKKRKTVTVQEKAMNKKSLDKQRNKTRGFPAMARTEGTQGAEK